MMRPTVYFDTSVLSAFWYEGADVAMLARRLHTREWWEVERRHFALWGSAFTEAELQAGVFARQADCLKMHRRRRYLPVTAAVRDLVEVIVQRKVVPPTKVVEAHLGITAAHGIDYLLTWNYAYMANPVVQARLDELCEAAELAGPLMVSPESIPQVRFGQSIRRK